MHVTGMYYVYMFAVFNLHYWSDTIFNDSLSNVWQSWNQNDWKKHSQHSVEAS